MQTVKNQDFQAFKPVAVDSGFGALIEDYEQEHDLFREQQKVNALEHRANKRFVRSFKGEQAHG